MKAFTLLVAALAGAALIWMTGDFPAMGDPDSPASTHVSPHYIEQTIPETSVPNIVTSLLADYRGYDTMFETMVVFCAGLACFHLLGSYVRERPRDCFYRHLETGVVLCFRDQREGRPEVSEHFERIDPIWTPHDLIVTTVGRMMVPFIQLFGLYVIAHGHHSPGGGFQGGVILGAALILLGLTHNLRFMNSRFRRKSLGIASALGVLIYSGTGLAAVGLGANFLDYAALAKVLPVDPIAARSLGILFVEIGVGITVMATMVIIYNNLASEGRYDEGL